MRSVPEQLKQLSDSSVSSCTQKVSSDINKDLKAIQANLLKTLKDNLKNEVIVTGADTAVPICVRMCAIIIAFVYVSIPPCRFKKASNHRQLHWKIRY